MKLYGIGNALLYYREQKKLSQLQVGEGICSEMTISRIETGEREFDSLISETLLSRIGKTANRFEFVLNAEDYYFYILREKIAKTVDSLELESAKLYMADYRENMPDTHVLHEQFILYYEALIMKAENKSEKEIVNCLYKAINLTRGDFKESTTQLRLFSSIELKIIYELFLYEEYSHQMLSSVFHFVDEMYDVEEKERLMIPFLYNLGTRCEQTEDWNQLEQISSRAIHYLQNGRCYLYLIEFYFMKVVAEYWLYNETEYWDERKKELVQRCNEIYYMSMIINDTEAMKKAEGFCKEKLGCQITM